MVPLMVLQLDLLKAEHLVFQWVKMSEARKLTKSTTHLHDLKLKNE
jgi:hypothetical protein